MAELQIGPPRPFDVVGLGLNAVDHLAIVPSYPVPGSRTQIASYVQGGGGQVATALCAHARLGLRVKHLGKVGDDANGAFSLQSLRDGGVDVADVITVPGEATQMAMILVVEGSGERTICWKRGAGLAFQPEDWTPAVVEQTRLLHLDTHDIAKNTQVARWARQRGVPVLIDAEATRAGVDELLRSCDVVLSDGSFGAAFTSAAEPTEIVRRLQRHSGASIVAMTLGVDGCLVSDGSSIEQVAAYRVDVVDTTGAGDVWHAAFGYGVLRRWPLDRIGRFANAAAALSCRALGGRGALPYLEQVQELMGEPLEDEAGARTALPPGRLIDDAWAFAREAHRGQTRDDGSPYFPHPCRVAQVLFDELGVRREPVLAAALLHDTLEDAPIDRGYFESRFGAEVTRMVVALTQDETLPRERYFEALHAASDDAVLVKIADRVDNLRQLHLSPKAGKKARYLAETEQHHLPLAARVPQGARLLTETLQTVTVQK